MARRIASSLLELLSGDVSGKKSQKLLKDELFRLNSSIKHVEMEGHVKRQYWEVYELVEELVEECCASPAGGFPFVNYLGRAGHGDRRDSAPKLNYIKALLLDVDDLSSIQDFGYGSRFSDASKELFLREISPVVGFLIRNYLVGQDPAYLAVAVFCDVRVSKTFLAEVYDDGLMEVYFDFQAWIVEPRSSDTCEAMRSVAKQIGATNSRVLADIDDMSSPEIVASIRCFLESKRYFLVFEDVSTVEFWYSVKGALLDDNNGSRIFVTTGSERVASACREASSSGALTSEPLSEEMVLALFEQDSELGHASKSRKLIWDGIIEMCADFPFAIVAVAGLMFKTENFPKQWRQLIQNFSFEVKPNTNLMCLSEILALRFLDLPHQLKSCFLYFSLFPKEAMIPNEKLFKLWIAEGFVKEETGHSLEEIAQRYLNELRNRNLVQSRVEFYGIENVSRVHCLMNQFIHQEAVERSFCQIWGVNTSSSFTEKSHRLLIRNNGVQNVLKSISESQVSTIFLSNVGALNHSLLVGLFEKYKLLTLLDVENSRLELLPTEIGNLSCLKYLSLRNTQLKILPKSVGKLQKLLTLDLTRTLLVELPIEIFMLRNLRHLSASRCDNEISLDPAKGVKVKSGIGNLLNLLTLKTMEANLSGMDVIQELKKLRNLRSLSVSRLTTDLSRALCACIEVMRNLESLRLHSMNNESLDLQNISSPPLHLNHLVLKGLMQTFPNWRSALRNLKVLCLSLSMLADDPLQNICLLPYLETLWLYRAYEGQRLHFQEGGFQSLKLLVLRDLQGLEAIEIEEGSLPLLEELRIGPSPLLIDIPSGINDMTNLKLVTFYDMSNEFVLRMKPEEGSEYWKVRHVQHVLIWYWEEGRRYVSYTLRDADLWRRLEDTDADSNDIGQRDSQLSFRYSDDEEDSAVTSNLQWDEIAQVSLSSDGLSFFTDDVEE